MQRPSHNNIGAVGSLNGAVKKRLPMGSWTEVVDYCRTSMAFENREIFRILFLDKNSRVAFATVRLCPLSGLDLLT